MRRAALAGGLLLAGSVPEAQPTPAPVSPQQALRLLMEGNERWARGAARHPHQSARRRRDLVGGQTPFAAVLSCIDSRVPPELIFDRGLGDLFTIRTGAQTADDMVLGSVEYGPLTAGTGLIFVLGHQSCGAVKAAIAAIRASETAAGHLASLVDALRPAYDAAAGRPGDLVDNVVQAQVRLTVERLKRDQPLAERIPAGTLLVVGGRYSLETGAVELIA